VVGRVRRSEEERKVDQRTGEDVKIVKSYPSYYNIGIPACLAAALVLNDSCLQAVGEVS